MPFVNIKITKENGTPTKAQKRKLIAGVTNLLAEVLGKNKASTVVIIDEINTDNYGLGGDSITEARKKSKNSANCGNQKNKGSTHLKPPLN